MRKNIAGRLRHLLLQVLCLPVKVPAIRITDAARAELRQRMSGITEYSPVATLLWASYGVVGKPPEPPRWGVAFYDILNRPYGRVVRIDGLPFVFIQPFSFERLDGATLDHRNNRFVVDERTAR